MPLVTQKTFSVRFRTARSGVWRVLSKKRKNGRQRVLSTRKPQTGSITPRPAAALQTTSAVDASIEKPDLLKLPETCILVGDIGGTNARLSVWKISKGSYTKIYEQWYPTRDYKEAGFEAILKEMCRDPAVTLNYPTAACFAIAGPVADGKGTMTNIGWIIDGASIEDAFKWRNKGYRVAVVNDFEALGYGIPLLDPSDLVVLNDVPIEDKAPIAVMGPGTGLGEAQLMWDEGRETYRVWPSEGAHADFAPRNDIQRRLQEWIIDGYGYCELEHVACGAGLERIYSFLESDGQTPVTDPPLLTAPEISKRALEGEDAIANEALDAMLSIVGAEAGHMGLRCMAHGGIYIAGGITPKVIDRVKSGIVLDAFLHDPRHRFHSVLQSFRLCAVLNEEVGLIGCRHQATRLLFQK